MTSIEWLEQELQKRFPKETYDMYNNNQFSYEDMIIKSKRMHKQEIIDAFSHTEIMSGEYFQVFDNAEEYYQETFKKD